LLIISCNKCGHTLYEGNELKLPEEVARQNGCTCPKCGSQLRESPLEIRINIEPEPSA